MMCDGGKMCVMEGMMCVTLTYLIYMSLHLPHISRTYIPPPHPHTPCAVQWTPHPPYPHTPCAVQWTPPIHTYPMRSAMDLASCVGTKHLVTPGWNQVLWHVVRSVTTVAKLTCRCVGGEGVWVW